MPKSPSVHFKFIRDYTHLLVFILCGIMPLSDISAQNKFEIGTRIDALVFPLNVGKARESGLGYYDFRATSKITQSVYGEFIYWPYPDWGISIGFGQHIFKSNVQYFIADLSDIDTGQPYANNLPFYNTGAGPIISLRFRKDRWKARLGYGTFQIFKNESVFINSVISSTIFNPGEGIISDVQLNEESSLWNYVFPYNLLQMDVEYKIFNNLIIKAGTEAKLNEINFILYSARITGFTTKTAHETFVLNDFKLIDSYISFTFGLAYNIGFGKYQKSIQ